MTTIAKYGQSMFMIEKMKLWMRYYLEKYKKNEG